MKICYISPFVGVELSDEPGWSSFLDAKRSCHPLLSTLLSRQVVKTEPLGLITVMSATLPYAHLLLQISPQGSTIEERCDDRTTKRQRQLGILPASFLFNLFAPISFIYFFLSKINCEKRKNSIHRLWHGGRDGRLQTVNPLTLGIRLQTRSEPNRTAPSPETRLSINEQNRSTANGAAGRPMGRHSACANPSVKATFPTERTTNAAHEKKSQPRRWNCW